MEYFLEQELFSGQQYYYFKAHGVYAAHWGVAKLIWGVA